MILSGAPALAAHSLRAVRARNITRTADVPWQAHRMP
jgi:hypothetical protein